MSAIPRPFTILGQGLPTGWSITTLGLTIPSTATSGIMLYNTVDQTTNYERLEALFSGNEAFLRTAAGGSGTNRTLKLGSGITGVSQIALTQSNSTGRMNFSASSASAANFLGYTFDATHTGTSGSTVIFALRPTYNQASGTAANTDLLINRTQTAVGSGAQLLIDAQVGSSSRFSVSNVGALTITNGTNASSFTPGSNPLLSIDAPSSSSALTAVRITSGTMFTNSSGVGKAVVINPACNQSGTAGYTALEINAVETATGSGNKRLLDLQVGGTSIAYFTNAGVLGISNGGSYAIFGRGFLDSSADGVWAFKDNAGTSWSRLCFGGTTSSFPALKRASAILQTRLADDSDYAYHRARGFILSGGQDVIGGSGSPEGVITSLVGSLYLRTDGGASTTLYVKESGTGNTGWVAK